LKEFPYQMHELIDYFANTMTDSGKITNSPINVVNQTNLLSSNWVYGGLNANDITKFY